MMTDETITPHSNSMTSAMPRRSYWTKLMSKRSMATVLLETDDDDDENRNELMNQQHIGSTASMNPSLITVGNNSIQPIASALSAKMTTNSISETHAIESIDSSILTIENAQDMKSVSTNVIDAEAMPSDRDVTNTELGSHSLTSEIVNQANNESTPSSMIPTDAVSLPKCALNALNQSNTNMSPPFEASNAIATSEIIEPSIARSPSPPTIVVPPHPRISMLNSFDLTTVGLSSTLAIGIFLIVGYVIRHIAGPAAILSIIIAAFCSYLAGSFYAELNSIAATPPMLSYPSTTGDNCSAKTKMLLPAYVFVHVCIGEFIAFIIGWNLLLDYVIGAALAAKGIAAYMDLLIFGNDQFIGAGIQSFAPKDWQILSSYFDFLSFFIPLLIAGPLVLAIRRNSLLNLLSIGCGFIAVMVVLIVSIFKANISNWTAKLPAKLENITSASIEGDGGFFAFGLEGVMHGAAIFTFLFVAFDAMVVGTDHSRKDKYIVAFKKTIPSSVISINGLAFVCLLGISVAVTLIQPYYSLDANFPLPLVFNGMGPAWEWATFVTLGCGIIALLGCLFALMHTILRISQTMSSDGLIFKLFGKFQPNKQPSIVGCLIFTLLASLFAGIFDVKQLINLLSIGALLLFFSLTIAVVMVRYTPIVDRGDDTYDHERGQTRSSDASTSKISWTAIMLMLHCTFAVFLSIFIQLIRNRYIVLSNGLTLAIIPTFIILMGSLILGIGMQSIQPLVKRFKTPLNPLIPGINTFICIYLLTTFPIIIWLRFIIWMILGISMYLICLRRNNATAGILPGANNGGVVINGGYAYEEHEINVTTVTEMDETTTSSEAIKHDDHMLNDASDMLRSVTPDVIPKFDKRSMADDVEIIGETNGNHDKNIFHLNKNRNIFDEIISADDVKETCIEMKESDGKVYFVEQLNHAMKHNDNAVNKDECIALEILDNVIKSEDKNQEELHKISELMANGEFDGEIDVMYEEIKRSGNNGKELFGVTGVNHSDDENGKLVPRKSDLYKTNVDTMTDPTLSDLSPTPTTENIEPEYATVKRSGTVLIELHPSDRVEHPSTPDTKHLPPVERYSTDFRNHLSILIGNQSGSNSPAATSPKADRSMSPKRTASDRVSKSTDDLSDFIQSNPTKASVSTVSLNSPINKSTGEIPTPPRFDPILYNTISNRTNSYNRLKFPATAQSIENEFDKAFQRKLQAPKTFDEVQLKRVPKTESLNKADDDDLLETDNATRMKTIRERLEKLLGRGPPIENSIHITHSQSEPLPDYPDAPASNADDHSMTKATTYDQNDEIIRYRKPVKPFDTVHKQKVLFNDVLKSISPDIRTSLHRTDSSASTSTEMRPVTYSSPSIDDNKH